MVFAPQLAFMDEQNLDDLVRYVEDGGILYLSGVEDTRVIERLLDAEFVRYTEEAAVYMAPTARGKRYFGRALPCSVHNERLFFQSRSS